MKTTDEARAAAQGSGLVPLLLHAEKVALYGLLTVKGDWTATLTLISGRLALRTVSAAPDVDADTPALVELLCALMSNTEYECELRPLFDTPNADDEITVEIGAVLRQALRQRNFGRAAPPDPPPLEEPAPFPVVPEKEPVPPAPDTSAEDRRPLRASRLRQQLRAGEELDFGERRQSTGVLDRRDHPRRRSSDIPSPPGRVAIDRPPPAPASVPVGAVLPNDAALPDDQPPPPAPTPTPPAAKNAKPSKRGALRSLIRTLASPD